MFPTVVGIVPDTMYCDCWQAKLAEMIGPYRRRHSRIVTFLDPEDVDVNFVPNCYFLRVYQNLGPLIHGLNLLVICIFG